MYHKPEDGVDGDFNLYKAFDTSFDDMPLDGFLNNSNQQNETEKNNQLTDISYSSLRQNVYDVGENSLSENDESVVQLRDLLKTWNLENVADHLIDQKIFIPVLKVIKQHHVQRLLKNFDMATEIMFEHNLEKWREAMEVPVNHQCRNKSCCSDVIISNPPSPATQSSFSRESTPTRFTPYQIPTSPDEYIQLAIILDESPKGLMLTEYYSKFNKFQEEQRVLLVNLIVSFYEEKSVPLSLASSHRVENEILQQFPTEKLEYYRVAKRGKIYNKYCNMKSSFKAAVTNHVLPTKKKDVKDKKSRFEKYFEPENDAESCVRCLKFDNLSAEDFDRCWKACSQFRLCQLKELHSTSLIMEMWPFYKNPSGYRLIDIDFKICFNDKDGLLLHWDNNFNDIVHFLLTHIKDKKIKAVVEKIRDASNTSDIVENGKNLAIFWALHGYFVPTTLTVTKKENKKVSTRFTIKDSQESFVFIGKSLQEVEDHLLHLKSLKKSIQPFIYCIGEDMLNINNITVYFDGIRYNFKNFVRAVDICFKTIYLFNLDFPPESVMFYSFIETFFYDFTSKNVSSKVHILSEYLKNNEENNLLK